MKRERIAEKILGDKATDYALKKIVEKNWEDPKTVLHELADRMEVELPKKSPADFVRELDDSPDKCFVWQMDMTEAQLYDFAENFRDEFVKTYNRDPEALHFIRNDVKNIQELDPDTVKARVEPWLNNQSKE
jgi:hypothetical protein